MTTMSGMFSPAQAFNQPLNRWQVGNVRDLSNMFHDTSNFNQPLHYWDVRNVTNMSGMFYSAFRFNQPLESWDVSNVTSILLRIPISSCFIVAAFTQMRHVPEALWPLCWVYQAQCLNLRSSLHEGSEISRAEAFTCIKPDFKKTPFLPFGTVVEYPVYRQPKLAEKCTLEYLLVSQPLLKTLSWCIRTLRRLLFNVPLIVSYLKFPHLGPRFLPNISIWINIRRRN